MLEQNITRLTLENGSIKVSWEVPYTDITLDDLILAFKTLCIGATFSPEQVDKYLKDYDE